MVVTLLTYGLNRVGVTTLKRRWTARSCYYCAVSDGCRRVYTNKDASPSFQANRIRDPRRVSYISLYVNGVIQPDCMYTVRDGKLTFLSKELPPEGAPIVLQFIRITGKSSKKRKRRTSKRSPIRKRKLRKGGEPMPASLIKLSITATSSQPTLSGGDVDTTVTASSSQYVALASAGTLDDTTLTILATAFVDDTGTSVTAFPDNLGYYNLYINGVLQQNGLSTITTSQIEIADGDQISSTSPVVVQFVASAADSTLTPPTASAPIITVNT
ncbi:MAG: hypothetical protein K0Q94_1395 [Paenibacillus sp.]|nr:hypothetical protein [Paenibacillus sp.]